MSTIKSHELRGSSRVDQFSCRNESVLPLLGVSAPPLICMAGTKWSWRWALGLWHEWLWSNTNQAFLSQTTLAPSPMSELCHISASRPRWKHYNPALGHTILITPGFLPAQRKPVALISRTSKLLK
jgi:hypothetical protein